jgi:hypothetical protein
MALAVLNAGGVTLRLKSTPMMFEYPISFTPGFSPVALTAHYKGKPLKRFRPVSAHGGHPAKPGYE